MSRREWFLGVLGVLVVKGFFAFVQAEPYTPSHPDPVEDPWRWRAFPELKGVSVHCLAEGKDGTLWFGTDTDLRRYDGVAWTVYTKKDSLVGAPVHRICVTRDSAVWVATQEGVGQFDGKVWISHLTGIPAYDILQARDGSLWAATAWGVARFQAGAGWTFYTTAFFKSLLAILHPDLAKHAVLIPDQAGQRINFRRVGIGVLLMGTGNHPTVARVEPGGPANRAGLKAGDRLLKVGDRWAGETLSRPFRDAPSMGRPGDVEGQRGSRIKVMVQNTGGVNEVEVEIDSVRTMGYGFEIASLIEERDGALWFGYRGEGQVGEPRVSRFDGQGWQVYGQEEGGVPGPGSRFCQTQEGALWAVSEEGLSRLDGRRWTSISGVPEGGLASALQTRDGRLWVGGEGLLLTLKGGAWRTFSLAHVPLFNRILDLLEAQDGAIYFAVQGEGAFRFDPTGVRYQTFEGLRLECQASDGSLYFVSQDRAVVRRDRAGWTRYGRGEGMIDTPARIVEGADGVIWVAGSHQGVAATCRRQGGGWVIQTHPNVALSLRSACRAADGALYFGAGSVRKGQTGGLIRFSAEGWTGFTDEDLTGIGDISAIACTPDGKVWAGGRSGLRTFEGKAWRPVVQIEELTSPITALHVGPDGGLWAGTRSAGALRFDGRAWIIQNARSGLPSNGVSCITTVDSSLSITLDHGRGILRRDGQGWARATNEDLSAETEGLFQDRQGALWLNGVSKEGQWKTIRYQPDRDPPETTLTLKPDRVAPSGNAAWEWIGKDPHHSTPQEDLQYSCRLNRGEWSPFASQRGYLFLSIPPGSHTFEVRARDRDFNVDPTPAIHRFVVEPPLWQTSWWIWMGAFLILAIVFLIKQIIQRDRQLSEFVSVVSHDMKTPLTAILVYIDNLLDGIGGGTLTEKQAYTLRRARSNGERLTRMINDLLDLSRMEAGKLKLHRTSFSLAESVREVVEGLQLVAQEKGIDLSLTEEADVYVRGDRDRIEQVVTNLVGNALKFTPQEGSVRVEVRQIDRTARVGVSDTGPGIHPSQQEAIFERFHQVQKEDMGIGLGLAISKKLVELHRGRVWVRSEVGKGSQFFFTLPAEKRGKG